jgi:hypothetical protein
MGGGGGRAARAARARRRARAAAPVQLGPPAGAIPTQHAANNRLKQPCHVETLPERALPHGPRAPRLQPTPHRYLSVH